MSSFSFTQLEHWLRKKKKKKQEKRKNPDNEKKMQIMSSFSFTQLASTPAIPKLSWLSILKSDLINVNTELQVYVIAYIKQPLSLSLSYKATSLSLSHIKQPLSLSLI